MPATGAVTFKLNVGIWNASMFDEVKARVADLSPLFKEIINEWRIGNVDKFAAGMGKESSGASFRPEPTWEPLSEKYMASKRRHGYPDSLMVRTGSLKAALTTEGQFFRMEEAQRAVFGTPNDVEDMDKVRYNWDTRQVIFLDAEDMKTISLFWNDYLTMGPKFKDIKKTMVRENARMDAELSMMFGGNA